MSARDHDLLLTHAPVVMRSIPVAIARCSADLRYLWVSQRYADWMGTPVRDIVDRPIVDLLGDDGLRSIRPHIELVLRGNTVEFEARILFKKLGPRWVRAEYSPTLDASGRPDGWVAAVTDITKHKEAEERLASNNAAFSMLHRLSARMTSQDALQTLLDAVVEAAIIATDAKMGTLRLFDATTQSLRIVAHSGFQRAFLDYFAVVRDAEDIWSQVQKERRRVIVEDVPSSVWFAGKPALAVMVEAGARAFQATPLLAHDDRFLGVLATHWTYPHRPDAHTLQILDLLAREAADLIEHRQREQALDEANRAKDEFLAMLGHELRNPLSPIVTALEILKRGGDGAEMLEVLERHVKHLTGLVDDLLDVSRITRGRIQIKKQFVRLQDVMARGTAMAMPLIEQRRHHLHIQVSDEVTRLEGDEARLAQVICNLLSNAAKYTDPGGRIDVEVHRTGGEVALVFRDNGVGISAELLPHIFDLFTQERQANDRARGGLGIGLTIVRSLVELHGGTVQAESPGPGRGSTFTVRLPIAAGEPAAVELTADAWPPVATTSRRILLVDDNEDALELLADILRAAGHTVNAVVDGPKALDAIRAIRPDVAILDIGLPVMDGYELARRIHIEFGPNPPRLIALTGYGQESDRVRARDAGFAEHLTKPVQIDCLLAALSVDSSPAAVESDAHASVVVE